MAPRRICEAGRSLIRSLHCTPSESSVMNTATQGSDRLQAEICMYTPTTSGGHALYALDLLSALTATRPASRVETSLITCSDLPKRYRTTRYVIHDLLPPMRPAGDFPSPTIWSLYRQIYYYRRDRIFLQWVRSSPGCRAVHFQEYTYWLAPLHFSILKRAGVRLFFTVTSIREFEDGRFHALRKTPGHWPRMGFWEPG